MSRSLIDNDTGEVIAEYEDGIKIYEYNSMNNLRYKINNKMFYKLYKDSTLIFSNPKINYKYLKTFFGLIRYMDFDTNEILKFNGFPCSLSQLAKLLSINLRTFYNHIKELERLNVLKRIKDGRKKYVIINPYFIGFGTTQTDEALKLFSKSAWAQCSKLKRRKKGK